MTKVAVQKHLYSKTNPNDAEDYFGYFEGNWKELIDELHAGKVSKRRLAALLLLQSSVLHLRNPSYRINDDDSAERFDVFKLAHEAFFQTVLLDGHVPDQMQDDLDRMLEIWGCSLLPAQSESWITSDNPALHLTIGETTPAIIFLPITPKWAVIATKIGVAEVASNQITPQDIEYLNTYSTINSIRHIYSNSDFDAADIKSQEKWYLERPSGDNWMSSEEMHMEPFIYPVKGMTLSFLKPIS